MADKNISDFATGISQRFLNAIPNTRFTDTMFPPDFFTYSYQEGFNKSQQRRLYENEKRIYHTKKQYASVMHHVPILMPPEEALRRSVRIKVIQLIAELDAGRKQAAASLRTLLFSVNYDVDKDLEKIIIARLVMEDL